MSRRKFNKEFKVAAVKLVLDDEVPVSHVAQQLSVHPNSPYRWVNEYEKYGEHYTFSGTPKYDIQNAVINCLFIKFLLAKASAILSHKIAKRLIIK